jgi:predicted transcriptional regulator
VDLFNQHGVKWNPVELVWQVLPDRRWQTVTEITNHVALPNMNVAPVIDFLEKYGFVESAANGRFRRTRQTPCPMEIAKLLNECFR